VSFGPRAVSTEPTNDAYAFGPFLLEPRERRLLRNGQPVPLTVRAFDLLQVLVRRPGRLVHKQEPRVEGNGGVPPTAWTAISFH
jgi:DNA-binding response OmpR family regulator